MEDGAGAAEPSLAKAGGTPAPQMLLTERQVKLLEIMGRDPMSIDVLIDRSSLAAQEVLQEMTLLTLRGQVKRVDGQTFVRKSFIKG